MSVELESVALAREALLRSSLGQARRLLVAYSGGVDSTYLLAVAHEAVGDGVIGVLADSQSLPRSAFRRAVAFTSARGIALRVIPTGELDDPAYARNDARRCYVCKSHLFDWTDRLRREHAGAPVAYGYTADDAGDYRPGQRAAEEHQVVAPLFQAGMGKAHIRLRSRALGLEGWDRPASPCLSSRLAYGLEVTPERLMLVETLEELLQEAGVRDCRARYDGKTVRIEVPSAELERVIALELRRALVEQARALGATFVSLDLEGLLSGKLNRLLP